MSAHFPSIVLVGGPSGVGKSGLAHALAIETGSTVAQVDDLQTAIETLVPPDRIPDYHRLATTYQRTEDPEEICRATEQLASWFDPAVRGVIANRVESRTSTVVEGDFISPEVAAEARSLGVRSVFLLGSEADLRANFVRRDGDEQAGRAAISAALSRRLADRCRALGLPCLDARPFDTLLSRALDALDLRGTLPS